MKLTGDRNHCPSCQEYFNSSGTFDRHRTGSYDPPQRRCLSIQEMEAKGMSKNKSGYWIRMPLGAVTKGLLRAS